MTEFYSGPDIIEDTSKTIWQNQINHRFYEILVGIEQSIDFNFC